jgi:hypothetical protein
MKKKFGEYQSMSSFAFDLLRAKADGIRETLPSGFHVEVSSDTLAQQFDVLAFAINNESDRRGGNDDDVSLCSPAELATGDTYVVSWDHESGPITAIIGTLESEVGHLGPDGEWLTFTDHRSDEAVVIPVDALRILQPIDGPWMTDAEVAAQGAGS